MLAFYIIQNIHQLAVVVHLFRKYAKKQQYCIDIYLDDLTNSVFQKKNHVNYLTKLINEQLKEIYMIRK